MDKIYDVIIIGAGPAGLSAGLYAGRAGLETLIIEKEEEGGQISQTAEIENYPGSMEEESGYSLTERMSKQACDFGAVIVKDTVKEISPEWEIKTLMGEKKDYKTKTVIIAAGTSPLRIGCPGEGELIGKGISYCATCDGAFFQDMDVYVVGGGNSAVEEAIYLTRYAKKVTVIHRREKLRAEKAIQEKAFANEKIEFIWNSVVKELKGEGFLETIITENIISREKTEIKAEGQDSSIGLFVFIGSDPKTEIFQKHMKTEKGYIITNDDMETEIPGVYAAGDVRVKNLRQVITAAADGATAAFNAAKYIEREI
ncbi:MAG TPA: thioredoxin-disulfide reductase [Bacillota bacterium]|mgnify:CR=1 FL=1|nr:thioredoxin-disulfide reductase [Bacillota bacterium]HUM56164.1 thioredoxin-disulfide reductase [Bacillota bacterium]